MKREKKFCAYCGNQIAREIKDGKLRDFCKHCNAIFYENPLPVACCIVANDNREILFVQRKKDPYKNMWCLPIGFAETGEEIKDAALRELKEETGFDGSIIRLIDVDTIDNYFYGSLGIVTYEAKIIGGDIHPGDDAVDARFFSIGAHPDLAWSSNEKALKIYSELYRDTWAMIDSFTKFYPDTDPKREFDEIANNPGTYVSNIMVRVLKNDFYEIVTEWKNDIIQSMSYLTPFIDKLLPINEKVLQTLQLSLDNASPTLLLFDEFIQFGLILKNFNMPLPDILNAMALSRKSIWTHVLRKKFLLSPLEIYTVLELNNRIVFIYDRINYNLARGYSSL